MCSRNMQFKEPKLNNVYDILKENFEVVVDAKNDPTHYFEVEGYKFYLNEYQDGESFWASISGEEEARFVSVSWALKNLSPKAARPILDNIELFEDVFDDVPKEELYEILDQHYKRNSKDFLYYEIGPFRFVSGINTCWFFDKSNAKSLTIAEALNVLSPEEAKPILFNIDIFKKYAK